MKLLGGHGGDLGPPPVENEGERRRQLDALLAMKGEERFRPIAGDIDWAAFQIVGLGLASREFFSVELVAIMSRRGGAVCSTELV